MTTANKLKQARHKSALFSIAGVSCSRDVRGWIRLFICNLKNRIEGVLDEEKNVCRIFIDVAAYDMPVRHGVGWYSLLAL